MRTNRYTPNFRLGCFKLGFEHHLLTRLNSSKPTWRDWLTYIWNIDQPLIDDRYAHEEFDYFIVGDDPLLSLIAGLYLAQAGHRVLLHPSQQDNLFEDYYGMFERRASMIDNFIFARLGFMDFEGERNLENLLSLVLAQIQDLNDKAEQPLLMVTESTLVFNSFNRADDRVTESFWVGGSTKKQNLRTLSAWDQVERKMARFSVHTVEQGASDKRASPKCKVTCSNIVATSHFHSSIAVSLKCHVIQLGESARPTVSFDTFTARDRIFDVLELEILRQKGSDKTAQAVSAILT